MHYCYVEAQVGTKPFVTNVLGGRKFQDVVIRRRGAVDRLRHELHTTRGIPKYKDAEGVIYGSPLVDIAATKELTDETIEIVHLLLECTGWDIRLLSKSPLIKQIARSLSAEEKPRVIFGLSTGTLDDAYGRAVEPTCPAPTKRIAALHWLQDEGYRTFAMLCPIPPQPMSEFIKRVRSDIRPNQCEHVWAEVINLRGASMNATVKDLQNAGLTQAAKDLQAVCGEGSQTKWEQYARDTFMTLADAIPGKEEGPRLHFMQYVTRSSNEWWTRQIGRGAVVLGPSGKQTVSAAGPAPATQKDSSGHHGGKDPKRVAAAKKAWETMRAKKAANNGAPVRKAAKPLSDYTSEELLAELGRRLAP